MLDTHKYHLSSKFLILAYITSMLLHTITHFKAVRHLDLLVVKDKVSTGQCIGLRATIPQSKLTGKTYTER